MSTIECHFFKNGCNHLDQHGVSPENSAYMLTEDCNVNKQVHDLTDATEKTGQQTIDISEDDDHDDDVIFVEVVKPART